MSSEDGSNLILGQEGDRLVFQHEGQGDPEPLAGGSSFYVRWVKLGNRKHIVCLGDDANKPSVDRVVVHTPYVTGTPHPLLPMKNGRRMWMSHPEPFISGGVSAQWLVPAPLPRWRRTRGRSSRSHRCDHVVVTPPLEWPQRYPEDFPEPPSRVVHGRL
jgi:hypothetical protein